MDIITMEWLVNVVLLMIELPHQPKSMVLAGSTAIQRWTEKAKN